MIIAVELIGLSQCRSNDSTIQIRLKWKCDLCIAIGHRWNSTRSKLSQYLRSRYRCRNDFFLAIFINLDCNLVFCPYKKGTANREKNIQHNSHVHHGSRLCFQYFSFCSLLTLIILKSMNFLTFSISSFECLWNLLQWN